MDLDEEDPLICRFYNGFDFKLLQMLNFKITAQIYHCGYDRRQCQNNSLFNAANAAEMCASSQLLLGKP